MLWLALSLAVLAVAAAALTTLQERTASDQPAVAVTITDEEGNVLLDEAADDEATTQEAAPTTAPIEQARRTLDSLLDYDRWLAWTQTAVLVGIVFVVAGIAIRVGRRVLLNVQEARGLPDAVMLPIRRTLRGVVLLLAGIVALQFAGFSVATVWTTLASVAALVAVGFVAVWSVLSNIACSFLLMLFKPFRIGDIVEIMDNASGPHVGGRVTDVTLMYVVVREEGDDGPAFIQIPNNLFFQKIVRRRAGRRAVNIEDHVDKHGLTGREQRPPGST